MTGRPGGWPLLLILAGACQCDEGAVGKLAVSIEVRPRILDLGTVPIGVASRAAVTVENTGVTAVRLLEFGLEPLGIFTVEPPEMTVLPPGSSVALVVVGRPTAVGPVSDTLAIRADDAAGPHLVLVRMNGVEQPPCDDGNTCTDDTFDIEANECAHSFADGRPCEPADRCIIGSVCAQGVCLGETKSCDDGNACTRDLCRQVDGVCVSLSAPNACDDGNPCTIDTCGPDGCLQELMPNGTPCEDGDRCTAGDSCFAGTCQGAGVGEGNVCDDGDSCTVEDTCVAGRCTGRSVIDDAEEGDVVFEAPLTAWRGGFLHRREVSLSEDGVFFALDHLPLTNPAGLTHVITTVKQCGGSLYEFAYRPPDSFVLVRYVRREMQLGEDGTLRIVVGVRQLPANGYEPQTTAYVLDPQGNVLESKVRQRGGETGRSLLPDGSHVFGVIWPLTDHPPTPDNPAVQNLVVVREARNQQVLWRHERQSQDWGEFLGVAGPRVLFWSSFRFGALDFNTGSTVWTSPTQHIAKEMALSTVLNLGVARVGSNFGNSQLLGVEILHGNQVFLWPENEDITWVPRTDPIISGDGRIMVMMQRSDAQPFAPVGLDWVTLDATGSMLSRVELPYYFPFGWDATRHEDDPYPTVADDGVAYVGYGDQFWAIDPSGGIRWTVTSTFSNAFTGTVPLLRDDGILLISEGNRRILGIKTNGGQMPEDGWPSFRHDGRRTNFTP